MGTAVIKSGLSIPPVTPMPTKYRKHESRSVDDP
jgi:hypothetical protein